MLKIVVTQPDDVFILLNVDYSIRLIPVEIKIQPLPQLLPINGNEDDLQIGRIVNQLIQIASGNRNNIAVSVGVHKGVQLQLKLTLADHDVSRNAGLKGISFP